METKSQKDEITKKMKANKIKNEWKENPKKMSE
jgi:hypothetical protein